MKASESDNTAIKETPSDRTYWTNKRIEDLTKDQWERLCDGCARCCVQKLEDIDTGEVIYTNVACRYLDIQKCRCTEYENRARLQPECRQLTPESTKQIDWMPGTCAYRLLRDGKALPSWHPLVSGDTESVHRAGISVRGRVIPESDADLENLEAYAREDI